MTSISDTVGAPAGGSAALLRAAIAAHRAGYQRRAESLYRLILGVEPNHPDAQHLLGVSLMQRDCLDDALASIQRAVALRPDIAKYHNSLGLALRAARRLGPAALAFRRAIEIAPGHADAFLNLAQVMLDLRRPVEGEALLRMALSRHLANPGLRTTLARALLLQNRLADGVRELEEALATQPADANALTLLGVARHLLGDDAAARAAWENALAAAPDHVDAHVNLGQLLLQEGAFAEGWRHHEWRLKRPDYRRRFSCPRWQGEPLDGRTILLWPEQGLGDALQFVRYAPLVAARGGRVFLECRRPLHRLLGGVAGVAKVFDPGKATGFDLHIPLMSLPLVFETRLDTIPAEIPYLPLPQATALPHGGGRCNVGLVWAGNPNHSRDRDRSRPLAEFAPLAAAPGVAFYSLQLRPAASQTPPPGMTVTPLLSDGSDFLDTAAAITALDLVVTVDTASAHLAGALGRPVWVLIDTIPDWRWLYGRDDSPWYPTMRLFRRERDWADVFSRIAAALRDFQPGSAVGGAGSAAIRDRSSMRYTQ